MFAKFLYCFYVSFSSHVSCIKYEIFKVCKFSSLKASEMLRIDWSTDYQRNAKYFEKHCKICLRNETRFRNTILMCSFEQQNPSYRRGFN